MSRLQRTLIFKGLRRTRTPSSSCLRPFSSLHPQVEEHPPLREGPLCFSISSYGGISSLSLNPQRVPLIRSPSEVLVRVHAASLNPLDVQMAKGYGAGGINAIRKVGGIMGDFDVLSTLRGREEIEFPLTLGRDFSGTIIQMGQEARESAKYDGLSIGDEVFGVVPFDKQGSHSHLVVTNVNMVRRKPPSLSHLEAASLPYVAMTSRAALRVTGGFSSLFAKKFLVLGGSGGMGTFCIQYLKALGAKVTTTCSKDAENLVSSLGADFVIDYRMEGFKDMVKTMAPYDCILDLSGPPTKSSDDPFLTFVKEGGQYITLSPPFLRNIDEKGWALGSLSNLRELLSTNCKTFSQNKILFKWAFFIPNGKCLDEVSKLVENGEVRPIIHKVFPFHATPQAYQELEDGHSRGKIVIDMETRT